MIALDTNVLVHAHRGDSPFHEEARAAVAGLAEGGGAWAIPWPCVHEFLGIVTRASLWRRPSTPAEAARQVRAWCGAPTVHLLSEDERSLEIVLDIVERSGVTGTKVHDARIVALCLGQGVRELWTADRDFTRFPALRTRNPLAS